MDKFPDSLRDFTQNDILQIRNIDERCRKERERLFPLIEKAREDALKSGKYNIEYEFEISPDDKFPGYEDVRLIISNELCKKFKMEHLVYFINDTSSWHSFEEDMKSSGSTYKIIFGNKKI